MLSCLVHLHLILVRNEHGTSSHLNILNIETETLGDGAHLHIACAECLGYWQPTLPSSRVLLPHLEKVGWQTLQHCVYTNVLHCYLIELKSEQSICSSSWHYMCSTILVYWWAFLFLVCTYVTSRLIICIWLYSFWLDFIAIYLVLSFFLRV